jgi:hypothetical protein
MVTGNEALQTGSTRALEGRVFGNMLLKLKFGKTMDIQILKQIFER